MQNLKWSAANSKNGSSLVKTLLCSVALASVLAAVGAFVGYHWVAEVSYKAFPDFWNGIYGSQFPDELQHKVGGIVRTNFAIYLGVFGLLIGGIAPLASRLWFSIAKKDSLSHPQR